MWQEDEIFLPRYGSIVVELKDGASVPSGLRVIGMTAENAAISAAWHEPEPCGDEERMERAA